MFLMFAISTLKSELDVLERLEVLGLKNKMYHRDRLKIKLSYKIQQSTGLGQL